MRWTETRSAPEQRVRVSTETYQLVTLEEGAVRGGPVRRRQGRVRAGRNLRHGDQGRSNATDETDRRLLKKAQDIISRSSGEDAWNTLNASGDLRVGAARR